MRARKTKLDDRWHLQARSLLHSVVAGSMLVFGLSLQVRANPQEPATVGSEAEVDLFRNEIEPLLQKYCLACHTSDDPNGKLVMESWEQLVAGGEHGPAFTAGQSESSRMLLMVTGQLEPRMPPDDHPGPSEVEIEQLRRWIDQGGKGPAGSAPSAMQALRIPSLSPAKNSDTSITALAIDRAGSWVALGSYGRVQWRKGSDPILRETPLRQPSKINDLRFSSDSKVLVVASGVAGLFGTATLIDVATGEIINTLEGHRDTLYAAELSPDGSILATAGYDANIILWDARAGKQLRKIAGHNGAIFDVCFSADGKVLLSASADETVKIWDVASGQRLDTLSQPQGEVWAVRLTPDQQRIVAASGDHRFRVWQFVSRDAPQINPLLETRFADDSPLLRLAFTPRGDQLLVASQSGVVSQFNCRDWSKIATLVSAGDTIASMAVDVSGERAMIATLDGEVRDVTLGSPERGETAEASALTENYLVVDGLAELTEPGDRSIDRPEQAMQLPRGAKVRGTISGTAEGSSQADWYRFDARRGEVWIVETRAAQDGSPLDSILQLGDASGEPLIRHRLQALRASYFTFRGKDSTQTTDFRLFDWESMELNDFLYSSGEVTRLWMYPRGPDSGFNVYPGTGTRHTFFDTTPVTHALGESAYVVRELAPEEPPIENGLPVFALRAVNDDDSARQLGTDSKIRFVAPADGQYTIAIDDTRSRGGNDFHYQLILRPASPDFRPAVSAIDQPIPAGGGREFRVSITRLDGYRGPVEFEILNLPPGLHATSPLWIEEDQHEAYGVLWGDPELTPEQTFPAPRVVARARILGRSIEHQAGELGALKTTARGSISLRIRPHRKASSGAIAEGKEESSAAGDEIRIKPGETLSAIVQVERHSFAGEVRLGNEFSGRNLPFGVFVDNIGLNGLMIPEGAVERQFFITASKVAAPTRRLFHLRADQDSGITSPPIMVTVEP